MARSSMKFDVVFKVQILVNGTNCDTLVVMKNGKIVNQATGARPKNAILGML